SRAVAEAVEKFLSEKKLVAVLNDLQVIIEDYCLVRQIVVGLRDDCKGGEQVWSHQEQAQQTGFIHSWEFKASGRPWIRHAVNYGVTWRRTSSCTFILA